GPDLRIAVPPSTGLPCDLQDGRGTILVQHADLIVTGARILTMDADNPSATAIAISGGHILAVGTNDDIEALAVPSTRWIEGAGRSLLPGFVESHLHLFTGAAELGDLHLTHVTGLDALTKAVRDYAAARADAPFLMAQHADY